MNDDFEQRLRAHFAVRDDLPISEQFGGAVRKRIAAVRRARRLALAMSSIERWWSAGEHVPLVAGEREWRIFVRRMGEGPTMTLLHGYPSSSHDWAKVAPALAGRWAADSSAAAIRLPLRRSISPNRGSVAARLSFSGSAV